MPTFYAVASKSVVAKNFDSELTLINLDTGQYFAAGGSAVEFWESACAGANIEQIEQALLSQYAAPQQTIKAEVKKLLQLFLEHGLLAETSNAASEIYLPGKAQKSWEPGWLEVFGDMKELLLLDPIHDVETEWPVAKKS